MRKKKDINMENIQIITNNDLNDELTKLNECIYNKFKCKITIDTKNKLCMGEGNPFEMIVSCISVILSIINYNVNLSEENKKVILALIFKIIEGLK